MLVKVREIQLRGWHGARRRRRMDFSRKPIFR